MEPSDKIKERFIKAYDELSDPLFRYCFFKVSNREKAKDLVQEVFTKSWEYLTNGGEISDPRSFLYKVANNLIIDYYRKAKHYSLDELLEKGLDFTASGSEKIEDLAEHKRALRILQEIPEKYREVIVMRFMEGLAPREISKILGISENAVSVRINRSLKQLREKLNIKNEQ